MAWLKKRLKDILGRILFATGLGRRLLADRAVVVAFHRIDDRYPGDPITLGRSEFLSFCDFFARHFNVVPLDDLVARVADGSAPGGALAITFDDGYRDNATFAAPELERRGLHATFFVTTDFVGTEKQAWWDRMRGIPSEWMSWEHVQELVAAGMGVAQHTASHPDLATLTYDEVREELKGSRRALVEAVGEARREFAFPYGGPENISEVARAAVRDSGCSCCFSCHGGTITSTDDPYHLNRTPINDWYISPYQFGFEVAFDLRRRRRAAVS